VVVQPWTYCEHWPHWLLLRTNTCREDAACGPFSDEWRIIPGIDSGFN
jgi:hypothetical protein